MTRKPTASRQRRSTRILDDGCTVIAVLRIDRRVFEHARSRAERDSAGFPGCTAEDILEANLNMSGQTAIELDGYKAPPVIEALYPEPQRSADHPDDIDDHVPF